MNNLYLADVNVAYEAVSRDEEQRNRNTVPVEHNGILKVRLERLITSINPRRRWSFFEYCVCAEQN